MFVMVIEVVCYGRLGFVGGVGVVVIVVVELKFIFENLWFIKGLVFVFLCLLVSWVGLELFYKYGCFVFWVL